MAEKTTSPAPFSIPADRMEFSKLLAYVNSILILPLFMLCLLVIEHYNAAMYAGAFCLMQLIIPILYKAKGFDFLQGAYRYVVVLFNYFVLLILSFELGGSSGVYLFYFSNIASSFVYFKLEERFKLYSSLFIAILTLVVDFYLNLNPFLNEQPIFAEQRLISYFTLTIFLLHLFFVLYYLVSMMNQIEEVNESKTHNLQAVVRTNDSTIYEIDKDYNIRNVWAADKSKIELTAEQVRNGTNIYELYEKELSQKLEGSIRNVLRDEMPIEIEHLSETDGHWYQFTLRPFKRGNEETRVSMTRENIDHLKQYQKDIDKYSAVQNDILKLLGNVIRTPLNTIKSLSEALIADSSNVTHLARYKIIQNSSENILSLVNGMIDFYKIESGEFELGNDQFDLVNMLMQIDDTYNSIAIKNRVLLRIDVDRSLPQYVKGDFEKLDQIISNLVGNALKFTEVGTVTITAQMVKENAEKVSVLFKIADTGTGIIEEKQHLFNNFDSIDLSTIRQFGETGVSLAVCKMIVRVMGGKLEMISTEGKGTQFSFIIPFEKVEPGQLDEFLTDNGELEGKTVLVADSNQKDFNSAQSVLESWGMNVEHANSGPNVLKNLLPKNYDICLMALNLDESDGYQTTTRIRASKKEKKRTLPIIGLSELHDKNLFRRVRSVGMNGVIYKPLAAKELRRVLIEVLIHNKRLVYPTQEISDEEENFLS